MRIALAAGLADCLEGEPRLEVDFYPLSLSLKVARPFEFLCQPLTSFSGEALTTVGDSGSPGESGLVRPVIIS